MGFIESLNKCGVNISYTKTKIYESYLSQKSSLEQAGFKVKIKNELDLFDFEITLKSFITKNNIDEAYEIFMASHHDMLDYISYEEKRRLFNNDLTPLLQSAPCYDDIKDNTKIYIAFYEPFINQRYTEDYQILTLKQHHDYVDNYQKKMHNAIELYGIDLYRTDFSSLQLVYEDDRHIDFYLDDLRCVFVFKKEGFELLNKIILGDKDCKSSISIDEVKHAVSLIEEYKFIETLDYLKEHSFINEKTFKKVYKKCK